MAAREEQKNPIQVIERMMRLLEVLAQHPEPLTLKQIVMCGEDILVEAMVRVAFVSGGRARPIPKPLRIAMRADQAAMTDGGSQARD